MRRARIGLIAGLAAALGLTLVGFTAIVTNGQPTPPVRSEGAALIGGPFTLAGTGGETVTEADLAGKPSAVFFGFTFCPDVCPTTLYELSGLMEELGDTAEKINVVFVSVDWQRDGPAEMASYLSAFDERIIGLTGSEDQIEAVTDAYRVHYERVPLEGGGYTIDHTASVYLMDSDGQFFGTLDHEEPRETMLAKLRRLAGEG